MNPGCGITIPESPSHTVGRRAIHEPHTRLLLRDALCNSCSPISAVVVHDQDFVDVVSVILKDRGNQRRHILFLVMTGDDE